MDFVTLIAKELREYKEATDARLLELEKFKEAYTEPSAPSSTTTASTSTDKKSTAASA